MKKETEGYLMAALGMHIASVICYFFDIMIWFSLMMTLVFLSFALKSERSE